MQKRIHVVTDDKVLRTTGSVLSQFQHQRNEDSSFDSICLRCLLTVASANHEDQLAKHEASHQCSPIRLFAIATGACRAE